MFTGEQFIAHAVGDYILQNQWMAENKTRSNEAAFIHAFTYTLPFVFITQSLTALLFILWSHYLIDRYSLAKYVIWFKNGATGPVTKTGYPDYLPVWLSTWLFIITDNLIHIICNGLAIYYLG